MRLGDYSRLPGWDQHGHKAPKSRSTGENEEKLEPSYTAVGNEKWCSHYGRQGGEYCLMDTEFLFEVMDFVSSRTTVG